MAGWKTWKLRQDFKGQKFIPRIPLHVFPGTRLSYLDSCRRDVETMIEALCRSTRPATLSGGHYESWAKE
jgi:hypothetical protein